MSEAPIEVVSETLSPVVDINLTDRPQIKLDEILKTKTETPLTNQEKRDLLKPEALAQLSTEEYVDLWKRMNPQYLSHVTKQGFYDGDATPPYDEPNRLDTDLPKIMHTTKNMLPYMSLYYFPNIGEKSVKDKLVSSVLKDNVDKESAQREFNDMLSWSLRESVAPRYADISSIHFASQTVPDDAYGAERGNAIFFVFPTDVLASQYNFSVMGREKDLRYPTREIGWNDVFVWPDVVAGSGIPLDAGLIFIPEKVLVDPLTGSRYASEIKEVNGVETRVVIEDVALVDRFTKWSKTLDKDSKAVQLAQQYFSKRDGTSAKQLDDLCINELQNIGFHPDAINSFLPKLKRDLMLWNPETVEETFAKLIGESKEKYKRAENTISTKEYWERYFSEHPDEKPKHIIYYYGDPTTAVAQFEKQNGIGAADTSKIDGPLLGFDDHHVTDMKNDPRANQGHDELVNLGNKIITEHYASKS